MEDRHNSPSKRENRTHSFVSAWQLNANGARQPRIDKPQQLNVARDYNINSIVSRVHAKASDPTAETRSKDEVFGTFSESSSMTS